MSFCEIVLSPCSSRVDRWWRGLYTTSRAHPNTNSFALAFFGDDEVIDSGAHGGCAARWQRRPRLAKMETVVQHFIFIGNLRVHRLLSSLSFCIFNFDISEGRLRGGGNVNFQKFWEFTIGQKYNSKGFWGTNYNNKETGKTGNSK